MDDAYKAAVESRGRNILISANLVTEMVDMIRAETERLDWLLDNMHKKGFDDMSCGICSREDIDSAMSQ